MASWERAERMFREVRYTLETPTNGAELSKVLNAAARDLGGAMDIPPQDLADDAILVTTEDETIVISWKTRID